MAGESTLTSPTAANDVAPSVVRRLHPQRLGAFPLALEVDLELHFLLLFSGEPLILNVNSTMEMMKMKASRPPWKPPIAPPAVSRVGKS